MRRWRPEEYLPILEEGRQGRETLLRGALAPEYGGRPPAGLIDVAAALLDFPSWDLLAARRGPRRAESLLVKSLVILCRHLARSRKGD